MINETSKNLFNINETSTNDNDSNNENEVKTNHFSDSNTIYSPLPKTTNVSSTNLEVNFNNASFDSDFNSDSDSSSDSESIVSDKNYSFLDDDIFDVENDVPNKESDFSIFNKTERVMFASSNLTVSDVKIMIEGLIVKFGMTRKLQEAIVSMIKVLAGPEYDNFTY